MSAHIEELTRRNESSTDFDVVAELASILSRFVIFPKNNPFGFVSSNQSELIMVKAGAIHSNLFLKMFVYHIHLIQTK
ncbi:MAG: hypothetical protein O2840_04970 [bacterium]|nr:hypothetical protein [bacterium]